MYYGDTVMTPAERARLLRSLLDEHDRALFELRDSSTAFDSALGSMRQTLTAIESANHAQGRAIDRVIAANKAALTLFNE